MGRLEPLHHWESQRSKRGHHGWCRWIFGWPWQGASRRGRWLDTDSLSIMLRVWVTHFFEHQSRLLMVIAQTKKTVTLIKPSLILWSFQWCLCHSVTLLLSKQGRLGTLWMLSIGAMLQPHCECWQHWSANGVWFETGISNTFRNFGAFTQASVESSAAKKLVLKYRQ